MNSLPYPGYSWQFTQHAIALDPSNLVALLKAARVFQGHLPNPREINRLLDRANALTKNVRADTGRAETWRDYQQVLAELGLMVSLRLSQKVVLTPMALAVLDGLVGYSEAMTTQALRYQYPNGFKNDVSVRLRAALKGTPYSTAQSLIALQLRTGVLVKPGVLILETLVGLLDQGAEPQISVEEVRRFLLPRFHFTHPVPVQEIIKFRRDGSGSPPASERRPVQEWFRFLSRTDLFEFPEGKRDRLRLTAVAINNLERVRRLLGEHKQASAYWAPPKPDSQARLNWFSHFGSFGLTTQWVMLTQEIAPEYQDFNYPVGREEEQEEPVASDEPYKHRISLREVSVKHKPRPGGVPRPRTPDEISQAYIETEKKKELHQLIVKELTDHFRKKGAKVWEDPRSVDLLVNYKGNEGIIEVKTVNARNFLSRLRLGVGQLFEYEYSRAKDAGVRPELGLAMSTDIPEGSWVLEFLKSHLQVAFIGKVESGYRFSMPKGSRILRALE